jgi:NAD(P)-dependent dehydrogenase (short-subunit alcohol dehydrogenase family)
MELIESTAIYTSLKDRVVVITGGASGIGEAIVEAFARQQAQVIFLDIHDKGAETLVQKVQRSGYGSARYFHCDLTDIDALQNTTGEILRSFSAIDILVNNAGNDTRHAIEEVTSEYWDRCMQVNLKHQFFMAQAVLPGMRQAGRGAIINMSSIGWMIPSIRMPVYVTAKAAIVGMTRTLAHEVGADGIRVNAVLPGAILTDRQRELWFTEEYQQQILSRQAIKRLILPQEVAKLILFLGSDESLAITNQSFVIDGGWV